MSTIGLVLLFIAMLAATALAIGGISLLRQPQDAKRGWLMMIAAAVIVGNVLIVVL